MRSFGFQEVIMNMNFNLPTRIVSGRGCVSENAELMKLGKKALIVTGKSSAKLCGALDDVTAALDSLGISYAIYDKIMENPTVAVCFEGGKLARESGCDFVIGIGGGSPLDASKAIAAYAADETLAPDDIFGENVKSALPILAIPTTAGTGSEVDPVAVLTLESGKVKKSFKTPDTFPRVAFLDAKYTETMSRAYTVSTALDALCHCIESFYSPKSTVLSRMFALEGAKKIYPALEAIEQLGDDIELYKPLREDLLYGSTLGGLAIGTTGTGFNHPLGYNLTLYKGIPHGAACAIFMDEYIAFNCRKKSGCDLTDQLCEAIGEECTMLSANMVRWSGVDLTLTPAEIDEYVENVKGAKNYANSPYKINEKEMREIYVRLFG